MTQEQPSIQFSQPKQPIFALPPPQFQQIQQQEQLPPTRSDTFVVFEKEVHELAAELLSEAVEQECGRVGQEVALEAEAASHIMQVWLKEA
jgi:hypothetical protein